MKLNINIISKDRACQLDLLLHSYFKFNFEYNVTILYKYSDDDYKLGYEKVINKYPKVNWIEEKQILRDHLLDIFSVESDYVLNFVDDEIIIRNIDFDYIFNLLENNYGIHCYSLRLGRGFKYCYTADLYMQEPEFTKLGISNIWNWKTGVSLVDYYYPSCFNSHVYSYKDFYPIIKDLPFKSVNQLEGLYNNCRQHFKSYMVCSDDNHTVNIANNIVQEGKNRAGNKIEYTLNSLNQTYLCGYVIDYDYMQKECQKIKEATYELPYIFVKE